MHNLQQIQNAVQNAGLWGKLIDGPHCRFHVGDRVTIEHLGTATILGAQIGGYHYAILLDSGETIKAEHVASIQPIKRQPCREEP